MPMKVSIITVCYNAELCIENAINSVLAQTYKNIEYIIVDGKSTDGTMDIINKYRDRISTVISEKDNGIFDAMNKGIRAATGEIIYFLNSDDRLYDKDVISDVVNEFNNRPDEGFIYGKIRNVDYPLELEPYIKEYKIIKRKSEFLINQGICHQSIFVRKWVFDRVGCFDPKYKLGADLDWLISVYSASIKMRFMDRYIAYYYYAGLTNQNSKKWTWIRSAIIYKHFSFIVFLFYLSRYVIIRSINSKRRYLFRNIKHLYKKLT